MNDTTHLISLSEKATALEAQMVFKNLDFYYGKFHALKAIDLEIYKRHVTAFIGPSGCGKSTLLRTMNRMYDLYPEQRASGELLLDGMNILDRKMDVNALRAKVGMVFQKPTPFPMSIYENIAFGVRLNERLSKGQMDERVEWALRKAAIWEETKDKLAQSGMSLSGDSNNGCALRAASQSNRRCCCSTNPLQHSTRFPPCTSRS